MFERMTERNVPWNRKLRTNVRRTAAAGYGAIALLVGCFGYWAASAPLSGAVVTPGRIAAAHGNILIQHREGGIIRRLLVREGDHVDAADTLIELERTIPRAELNRLQRRLMAHRAKALRLEAERDGLERIEASTIEFAGRPQTDFENLLEEQRKEFTTRLERFRSEQRILRQRVAAHRDSVSGLQAQRHAVEEQIEVVEREINLKADLLDKGLTDRNEHSRLLRTQADLVGQAGRLAAELAAANARILEAREQIEHLATRRVEDAMAELDEVRSSMADVEEQIKAAEAVLARTTIKAPVAGIVVSSRYNSRGSVIAPGEDIMEILPTASDLVVDARLHPRDVDLVRVGQSAKLRLAALNARTTPEVAGTVTQISADRLVDEATQEPYFRARLQISRTLPAGLSVEQLYPGMPVEAFINTGDRTFFEYLARPIMDSFARAFTEQ